MTNLTSACGATVTRTQASISAWAPVAKEHLPTSHVQHTRAVLEGSRTSSLSYTRAYSQRQQHFLRPLYRTDYKKSL